MTNPTIIAFMKSGALDPHITHYLFVPEPAHLPALEKEYLDWRGKLPVFAPYPERVMFPKTKDWQRDDDRLIRFPDWLVLRRDYAIAGGPTTYNYGAN